MNVDLSDTSRELLAAERAALSDLLVLLGRVEGSEAALKDLRAALDDLDGSFLLVVCGEYNAGKSTLLNALLGMRVMPEGVTPTTDRITVIGFGEELTERTTAGDVVERTAPIEVLKELSIVDTPGTNAIIEGHQELTEGFIPRADLVLFVTSADRPYTESEREFLGLISSWGKKVSMVVNKADILEGPEELERVLDFVAEHTGRTLGSTPPVLAVAARNALRAREAGDADGVAEAGLTALEEHIRENLEAGERFRLKLLNPLGVGLRVIRTLDAELGNRQ
ncbi:MAG TPA: dynamin family protein, partial [Deinococcales bacterium]|nr:dynamin family protein [Deinococcales bacterium]